MNANNARKWGPHLRLLVPALIQCYVGFFGSLSAPSHPGVAALSDPLARKGTGWPLWQSLHFAGVRDWGPLFLLLAIAAKLSSCSLDGAMEKCACILPFYHTRCRAAGVVHTFSLHLPSLARYCMTCLPRTQPVALLFLLTFAAVILIPGVALFMLRPHAASSGRHPARPTARLPVHTVEVCGRPLQWPSPCLVASSGPGWHALRRTPAVRITRCVALCLERVPGHYTPVAWAQVPELGDAAVTSVARETDAESSSTELEEYLLPEARRQRAIRSGPWWPPAGPPVPTPANEPREERERRERTEAHARSPSHEVSNRSRTSLQGAVSKGSPHCAFFA